MLFKVFQIILRNSCKIAHSLLDNTLSTKNYFLYNTNVYSRYNLYYLCSQMLNYIRVKPWLRWKCRNVKRIPLLVLWINLQILETLKKNDFVKMKSTHLQGLNSACTHLTSTSKYLKFAMCWKGEKMKAFSWREELKKYKSHVNICFRLVCLCFDCFLDYEEAREMTLKNALLRHIVKAWWYHK